VRLRNVRRVGFLLVLLCSLPAVVDAQEVVASDAVAALNRVMHFRLFWLRDPMPLATCTAFEVLGRPADFPSKLSPFVAQLLDQDANTCGRQEGATRAGCPIVQLERLSLLDPTATVELLVNTGHYLHRERYVLERRVLDRERRKFTAWSVQTVVLSDVISQSGGPSCPDAK
jgi:hypothetical protein